MLRSSRRRWHRRCGRLYEGPPNGTPADRRGAARRARRVDASTPPIPEAQGRLFTLINELPAGGGRMLVAAGHRRRIASALRDDLRTRVGWACVYELAAACRYRQIGALSAYADERGFRLSDDVIAYLLAHGRRDMPTLSPRWRL